MALFDPFDPQLAIDPYPAFKALRETQPVYEAAPGFWVLVRHQDVLTMMQASVDLIHHFTEEQKLRGGDQVVQEPYFKLFQEMVFFSDAPDHMRRRRHIQSAFTKHLNVIRPKVDEYAERIFAARKHPRSIEATHEYAIELPELVTGELVGVPEADRKLIADQVVALSPALEFLSMTEETAARANAAAVFLNDYFHRLLEAKRSNPGADLLTDIGALIGREDGLTESEVIANAVNVYVAGNDTTSGGITLALYALARHPEEWRKIVTGDVEIMQAVDELMRWDGPGQGTGRYVLRDTDFDGTVIPAGARVLSYMGAACRDPAVFDDPDTLNLSATQGRKTSMFGNGIHSCLGRVIARLEIAATLRLFAREAPGLKLDGKAVFRKTALLRGVEHLPLAW